MQEHLSTPDKIDIPHMMEVTKRLSEVLTEEASLLKDMKLTQVPKLHDEKMQLTSILEEYKKMLAEHPEALKYYSRKNIDMVREQAIKLEAAIVEDEDALFRARRVHSLIINAIKKSIHKHVSLSNGYNNSGNLDDGIKCHDYIPPVTVRKNI